AAPNDVALLETLCAVLGDAKDKGYASCAEHLLELAPDSATANYYGADLAATDGDFELAKRRLDRAHALGMPDGAYEDADTRLRQMESAHQPTTARWILDKLLWVALWLLVPWLAILVILYAIGRRMSRIALRALDDPEALAPSVRRRSRSVLAAC